MGKMSDDDESKKAEFQFIKNSILTGTIYYSYFQSEVIKTQNHTDNEDNSKILEETHAE